jgi:MOSC domain-containing protein YiiM
MGAGMHVPLATLETGLDVIRGAPRDTGRVELIVRRPQENEREVIADGSLDEALGLVGDRWPASTSARTAGAATQLTLMNARAAAAVAGDRDRWQLAGDQLYVDFDLSTTNVPPGTRLRIGSAIVEISAEPHRGCGKFASRFGVDAMKFVNSQVGRELNLRGVNARVVIAGTVRTGDAVVKAVTEAAA